MKNIRMILGVLFMSTLSFTAFSQTASGGRGNRTGSQTGKPEMHRHDGEKGHKGKGHAYGRHKEGQSGREFGQHRSEEAREHRERDHKNLDSKPARGTYPGARENTRAGKNR